MKEIYLAIMAAIEAKVPEIRWIDFDLGQLDEGNNPPLSWPCVLLGFGAGDYTDLSPEADAGSVSIEVRIGFKLLERTHSKANTGYRNQALEYLDVVEAVRLAIVALKGDTFTPMSYRSSVHERRADYRIWNLGFECTHYPAKPDSVYQDYGPGPNFCAHPDIGG